MPYKDFALRAGGDIPETDDDPTPACERLTIRTERNAAGSSREHFALCASRDIPKPDGIVRTATCEG